jgi:hypothetical protein
MVLKRNWKDEQRQKPIEDRIVQYKGEACILYIGKVHPLNVRFQNVRFQNVRFQNVCNVRFAKRQVNKTSGLQNVRFTKHQVFKTSGCKKTSIYILYLLVVEIRRFCCSHVCRQSDGYVLFSILEGCFAIIACNK